MSDAADEGGVRVSLIAAVSENGVIGVDGALPWRLPEDLKRFKRLTLGHTVLMGRKTFESVGIPLKGRRNVVMTRDSGWSRQGVWVAGSVEDGLALARRLEAEAGGSWVFVVGGESVYRATLGEADRLDLTLVHAEVEGNTRFPDVDASAWRVVEESRHDADARHAHAYTFRVLERAV